MAQDTTVMMTKPGSVQSTIFNTSIRGWIALVLALALAFCFFLVVIAPFCNVDVPQDTRTAVITLFTSGIAATFAHYFKADSREGQKQ